jgi:hypothetical protein
VRRRPASRGSSRVPLTQARLVEAIRRYHPVAAREAERARLRSRPDLVRGGVEVLAYTRDVATDGCFLLTHELRPCGETLRLTLHLPITGGRDVKVEAEVVRVAAAAPDGTGAPGIALRFTTIAPADRVELGRYLRSRRRGRGMTVSASYSRRGRSGRHP